MVVVDGPASLWSSFTATTAAVSGGWGGEELKVKTPERKTPNIRSLRLNSLKGPHHLHIFAGPDQQLLSFIWQRNLPRVKTHFQLALDGGIPMILHRVIGPAVTDSAPFFY